MVVGMAWDGELQRGLWRSAYCGKAGPAILLGAFAAGNTHPVVPLLLVAVVALTWEACQPQHLFCGADILSIFVRRFSRSVAKKSSLGATFGQHHQLSHDDAGALWLQSSCNSQAG